MANKLRERKRTKQRQLTDSQKAFGQKIKELRKLNGLLQRDVAKLAGVNRSYISRVEAGDYETWTVDSVIRLAQAFNVHPHILFQSMGLFTPLEEDAKSAIQIFTREPDLQIFFTTDWVDLSDSEKELVRRVIGVVKEAKDKRLNKNRF